MNTNNLSRIVALAIAVSATSRLLAQAPHLEFPAPSPGCTIKQRVGLTDIEIVYSRPSMKGRPIFGGLVPFGTVWRTGANAATKITFSTPVKLNGTDVAAGAYALYTIPGEDEWTIILNKGVGKSGTQYDEKEDVVRFKAKPSSLNDTTIETFTIEFSQIRDESALIDLLWDKTVVPIRLQLDVTSKLVPQIEAAMSASEGRKPYYQAAMFYYDHNLDIKKAAKWVDAAIAEREAYYIVHLKAKILAKMGDKQGAIAAAKWSTELAEKANDSGYVRLNKELIASLNQ
jgi:Protein of unknown function (DUF2911)